MAININTARLYLINLCPYFATVLYSLIPIPVKPEELRTMGVDKFYRLYYNEELDWDVKTTATVLYHEINHILRDHCDGRPLDREPFVWNMAGDLEINDDILSKDGWSLPKEALLPKKFGFPDNLLAEQYYEELKDKIPPNGCFPIGIDNDGEGGATYGDCGSIADGSSKDYEKSEGDSIGRVSRIEHEVIKNKVAHDIKEHAKLRGDVPGQWQRWADAVLNPQIPWQRILKSKIYNSLAEVAGRIDYTYRKPSRRADVFKDIIMPSMIQPKIKTSVVIDTSGSMDENDLSLAVAEVGGILRATGSMEGVTVFSVDAAVHEAQKVFDKKQIKLVGGGGTDMGVGIEAASSKKPRPDVIIVLTDGETGWPQRPPDKIKVIVGAITRDKSVCDRVPEWATTVHIKVG